MKEGQGGHADIRGLRLTWTKLPVPGTSLALTNRVFVSDATYEQLAKDTSLVEVNRCIFALGRHSMPHDWVALSDYQRTLARVGLEKEVLLKPFVPPADFLLASCSIEVSFPKPPAPNARRLEFLDSDLEEEFRRSFKEQALANGQLLAIQVKGTLLKLQVKQAQPLILGDRRDSNHSNQLLSVGLLVEQTGLSFAASPQVSGKLLVLNNSTTQRTIFQPDFSFEELGIGGLSKEFGDIFRRAFAARVFPPRVLRAMGIKHVKGMLLYGPPGNGKTLLARQLAKFLKAVEPKVIAGPELLDKMVGETERKVRMLFADAEEDFRANGENAQLHVIVLDEMDSICKTRGSSRDSTGVSDNIVNQFLSKIDGVEALDNVLLIGMTNRKELLDPALLRPGRLELHVEIGLPGEAGRLEILQIHTAKLRKGGFLESSVSLEELAARTRNFSGAELEALVRAAVASAMSQKVDVHNLKAAQDLDQILVTSADFDLALKEVRPAFGQDTDSLEQCVAQGIIPFVPSLTQVLQKLEGYVQQARSSPGPLFLTSLLHGIPGSGKSALAAHVARRSDFPFIRRLSGEVLAGETEFTKLQTIKRTFEDAEKSPLSLIILDDLERLVDYACIGQRFSNNILQLLFGLLKKRSEKGHRMLVIGTTSELSFLREVGFNRAFGTTLHLPALSEKEAFRMVLRGRKGFDPELVDDLAERLEGHAVGIRTLLEVIEQSSQQLPVQLPTFMECLQDAGVMESSEYRFL
mmetsp:Transcript_44090/g.82453  ORF Transcript_44090/g.82453 Transcript_44090/m.82453 type:complete len:750 (+) Transcript_44090:66-2315(+)